jgi:histidinol-phosphate aminotransferase
MMFQRFHLSPGFVMYGMTHGWDLAFMACRSTVELDRAAMLAAIAELTQAIHHLHRLPDNPRPTYGTTSSDRTSLMGEQGVVVMVEAYQPFASKVTLTASERHSHVLLMRTLNNFGLAGGGCGWAT